MANTSSAKKAIRSQQAKFAKNLIHRRAYRNARKAVLEAVEAKDKKAVQAGLIKFYKEIDKAAKVKALHVNAASRQKSRLTNTVNKAFAK